MTQTDFTHWANQQQLHIEQVLAQRLPKAGVTPARLHDAMRYAVLGGGKRVRPLLVALSSPAPINRIGHAVAGAASPRSNPSYEST